MRRLSGVLGAATLVVFLMALGACTTTQSPGTQIDDATIHTAVKAKLTTDHFSNIVNIDINVTNGIVTLAGEVPNPAVRLEAEKEALSVNGVKKVINNLQVKHPA
jgi:hyperosmotically inducible protein